MEPHEITWKLSASASRENRPFRDLFGADYDGQVLSLRRLLCGYFEGDCTAPAANIHPVGSVGALKVFKVRWAIPGGGKSSGLRICIRVDCEQKLVELRAVMMRRDATGVNFLDLASGE